MRDLKNNYDDLMDFLGDAFEPICRIMADEEIAGIFRSNGAVMSLAAPICKNHRDDIAAVIAACRGITVEEFRENFDALELFRSVVEMLKSPAVTELFKYAEQKRGATSSVSASQNLREGE